LRKIFKMCLYFCGGGGGEGIELWTHVAEVRHPSSLSKCNKILTNPRAIGKNKLIQIHAINFAGEVSSREH